MLGEEFKMWPADPFFNATLVIVSRYITKLGNLEERFSRFIELPNGNTEKSNKMLVKLDIVVVISETDHQDPPYLIDLKAKQANKKKEKAERRWQKKINLV